MHERVARPAAPHLGYARALGQPAARREAAWRWRRLTGGCGRCWSLVRASSASPAAPVLPMLVQLLAAGCASRAQAQLARSGAEMNVWSASSAGHARWRRGGVLGPPCKRQHAARPLNRGSAAHHGVPPVSHDHAAADGVQQQRAGHRPARQAPCLQRCASRPPALGILLGNQL